MQNTPLYSQHLKNQAKIVDFAGWQMPIQYTSIVDEHMAVRTQAGIFDVSHMGVVEITGKNAFSFLQMLLANDVAKLKTPGTALYSVMLNEHGGVIDDLIVYFMAPEHYRMVINAGCREKDLAWLQQQAKAFSVSIVLDTSLAMIALQGPHFAAVFGNAFPEWATQLPAKAFTFAQAGDMFIARTGYTGEEGVEIILPAAQANRVWEKCLEQGARPIGLGARDTLRLEAGLNLYSHEMDETVSPWQANLAWTIALSERDFIGKAILLKEKAAGIPNQLVGVILPQGGVLRAEQVLETNLGKGVITSGTFSPFLKVAVGMARVPVGCDADISVIIRNKPYSAHIVNLPFVKKGQISKETFAFLEVNQDGTHSR